MFALFISKWSNQILISLWTVYIEYYILIEFDPLYIYISKLTRVCIQSIIIYQTIHVDHKMWKRSIDQWVTKYPREPLDSPDPIRRNKRIGSKGHSARVGVSPKAWAPRHPQAVGHNFNVVSRANPSCEYLSIVNLIDNWTLRDLPLFKVHSLEFFIFFPWRKLGIVKQNRWIHSIVNCKGTRPLHV